MGFICSVYEAIGQCELVAKLIIRISIFEEQSNRRLESNEMSLDEPGWYCCFVLALHSIEKAGLGGWKQSSTCMEKKVRTKEI